MSSYDSLASTYTFHLYIERDDREIIDATITAKDDPGEIAKAKKDLKRLLDAYSPTLKASPAPAPDIPPPQEPENSDSGTPSADQPDKAEDAAPSSVAQTSSKRPNGAKGLLLLRCAECGNTFGTFLREYQTGIACKCGHQIDLTAPLARYHISCPSCGHEGFGRTNLEDPEIEVRCRCGRDVTLRWVPDAKGYQN